MAKRLSVPSKEIQLFIVGPLAAFKASRVQRVNLGTQIPSTTVNELGNSAHVGDVKDLPNVTLTFSAMDVGIKIFSALTGTNAAAFPAGGVDISSLGEIDAILYTKSDTLSDYVKSIHAKKLQISQFTYTYNVGAESTEDYTAVGSERRYFTKDVVVDTSAAAGTTFTLVNTPLVLKNGNYCLSVIIDGVYLTEVANGATLTTGTYSVNSGTKVVTFFTALVNKGVFVYQADPAGTNWTDVSDSTIPIAIRGDNVPITIKANSIPRVQSVTINGTLNTTPVKEMGNRQIVGNTKQIPEVTGTITVLDTDNELISLFQYGTLTSGTEYAPGEGCVVSGVDLLIELQDPCDTDFPYTVVKQVYIDSLSITGDAYAGNVGQDTTVTWNFKSSTGHCKIYSGNVL
jgi:hypothetical protein